MVFIPEIEQQSLLEQQAFQLKQLKEVLEYVKRHSPFYQRHFRKHFEAAFAPCSLADLELLPTTSKEDLQTHNLEFLCVPRTEVREYMATSGTLGLPVTIALTEADLQRLAYNEYLSFHLMELEKSDTVQLMLTLDRQFMAGMAYYGGLARLGAAVIRSGPGLPALQWEMMQQLDVTALVAVPSFLSRMLDHPAAAAGKTSPVKKILAIGESLRNAALQPNVLARKITREWNVQLYGTYASTEMQTAFTECSEGKGGHHHPELLIVEILDDDGRAVPEGEPGEVVITTLGIEGMPLIRYRTGDICKVYNEPCACGRSTLRLGPVLGRKKQMLKVKGTSLYPPQLFDTLNDLPEVIDYVLEVTSDADGQDELTLYLHTGLDETECAARLKPVFRHKWRVTPHLIFAAASTLQQMQFPDNSRKPVRFRDLRPQNIPVK